MCCVWRQVFKRWLKIRSWEWALTWRLISLEEEILAQRPTERRPCEDKGRRKLSICHRERSRSDPFLRAVTRHQPGRHLDLRLPASRTVKTSTAAVWDILLYSKSWLRHTVSTLTASRTSPTKSSCPLHCLLNVPTLCQLLWYYIPCLIPGMPAHLTSWTAGWSVCFFFFFYQYRGSNSRLPACKAGTYSAERNP